MGKGELGLDEIRIFRLRPNSPRQNAAFLGLQEWLLPPLIVLHSAQPVFQSEIALDTKAGPTQFT